MLFVLASKPAAAVMTGGSLIDISARIYLMPSISTVDFGEAKPELLPPRSTSRRRLAVKAGTSLMITPDEDFMIVGG